MATGYTEFRKKLEEVINAHSMENNGNTPDFILAEYLQGCLAMFDKATNQRDKWYNFEPWGDRANTTVTTATSTDPSEDLDAIMRCALAYAERLAAERAIELAEAVIGQYERPAATSIQENGRLMMGKNINGTIEERNALRAEQRKRLATLTKETE